MLFMCYVMRAVSEAYGSTLVIFVVYFCGNVRHVLYSLFAMSTSNPSWNCFDSHSLSSHVQFSNERDDAKK